MYYGYSHMAHGVITTKCNTGCISQLVPVQVLKLKQLTVLSLAEVNKISQTYVSSKIFLSMNACQGIVRGKLDQLKRCFEVQFAAGRDLRPGQLGNMIHTLENLSSTSKDLLVSIQDKIKGADNMSEVDNRNRKEVEERVEEVKKSISLKEEIFGEPSGVMDYEEDRSRPKRF
ncbi:PREDICTED: COP9 signalosome complex subunit 7-like isoform X2 [Camelina sativa]|uniref:COP9 signalosome complex subunit 7-like isoform X2 n=1 Tax=Camelina sativa TaxID=90675 RepID=A0ABM0VHT0_CAMSA|nr:PREDICTED: COP9 signalosome complex subunit 7-like isoform X2 [Camelina sativa]